MELAGFSHSQFFYPLPDYKLPQLIYSDRFLPGANLKERLILYHVNSDTMVAVEQELYQDVIENGVFPFFANSFLVECGREENLCLAVYAAVSTDRGREGSYATTIYAGNTVTKRPLYEEGKQSARELLFHMEDLKAHGIPVVRHTLSEDGSLKLPYISWPTLSNYIKTVIKEDTAKFLQILDQIYAYILQSSEPASENELLALQLQKTDSEEERERKARIPAGSFWRNTECLIPGIFIWQKRNAFWMRCAIIRNTGSFTDGRRWTASGWTRM